MGRISCKYRSVLSWRLAAVLGNLLRKRPSRIANDACTRVCSSLNSPIKNIFKSTGDCPNFKVCAGIVKRGGTEFKTAIFVIDQEPCQLSQCARICGVGDHPGRGGKNGSSRQIFL